MTKQRRGEMAFASGVAAENIVERDYLARGHTIAVRRFKKRSGEIDLIMRKDGGVIFVEVKKSKTHEQAARAVTPQQLARIYACASEFLAHEPDGQDTPSRVDVALVDSMGKVECLENVSL